MLPNANSGLMGRLQSFLPQMEAANKHISSAQTIDDDMVKVGGAADDSDGSDNNEDTKDSDTPNNNSADVGKIELTVALGDFSNSLLSKMEEGETIKPPVQTDEGEDAPRDDKTKSFLKRELASISKSDSSPKKKPLIEFVE